jgi:hypothetical protein
MNSIIVNGKLGECPMCGHAPIMHDGETGNEGECRICKFLVGQGQTKKVCNMRFQFKLSYEERYQASKASKDSYPMHTVCTECGFEWCQHRGYLCPSGDSTFLPLLDCDRPYLRRSDVEN